MGARGALAVALVAALGAGQAAAQPRDFSRAAEAKTDFRKVVARPAMDCAAFAHEPGAGLSFEKAEAASVDGIRLCHLVGRIEGRIRFEAMAPEGWNGRLFQIGNGGHSGEPIPSQGDRRAQLVNAARLGFLATANDMGHVAAETAGGTWGHDPEAVIDWSWRAHHLNAVQAKAIAARYYARPVGKAYFAGCSTGGRTGFLAAQRFPADFDGILAGAPVFQVTTMNLANALRARLLKEAGMTRERFAFVSEAIRGRCDGRDGVKDGIVDPQRCDFRPKRDIPVCHTGLGEGCLTPAQLAALEAVWTPIRLGSTATYPARTITPDNLATLLPPADGRPPQVLTLVEEFMSNVAYHPKKGPYPFETAATVEPDRYLASVAEMRRLADAENPDLSAFAARGGKMITYFGWEDGISQDALFAYRDRVSGRLGSARTDRTWRIFMAPGMGHCSGGRGADYFDLMSPLIDWVEAGAAPEAVTAVKREVAGAPSFQRKLCPYPKVAVLRGRKPDVAASYHCEAHR